MTFAEPQPNVHFAEEEKKILEHWEEIQAFETQLELSKDRPRFSFYDGPPFATGLPHYGHLLTSSIKDIVTRYACQQGFHVERRFGWDTHGLPVEHEIDKKLGIHGKEDVAKIGIKQYNAECRAIVMRYADQWKTTIKRMGRWIDLENDYKTLYPWYMESIWWVFKTMYEKGLIYKGFKVMPYSTACCTPLSNFEVQDTYAAHVDKAVTVTFPLVSDPSVKFVAWTTTPWTLPSNLVLAVKDDFEYVKIRDIASGEVYIILKDRLVHLYPEPKKGKKKNKKKADADECENFKAPYEIMQTFKGKELEGLEYVPIFDTFLYKKEDGAFRVVCADFVTNESGTGIVQCAPAFGEDDFNMCLEKGIIKKGEDIPCPVNEAGRFTDKVAQWKGLNVKEADPLIVKYLKEIEKLVKVEDYSHNIPFCWRSDTPLIYKAVTSWYVKVESMTEKLIEANKTIHWTPEFVGKARFHNWLENSKDWSISRSRYWGTPLPVWQSEDGEETVVIGSIEELYELSGVRVTDLHKDSIDHITIPSKQGKEPLKRVEAVFDCWFESGSMPYAQHHYPFENKDMCENGSFPANFIAEGLDQTRGWFYTLLVIGCSLFDRAPYQNVIVNGLVLAADGKKMSKRLKNYPDPKVLLDTYGADALRLCLINSPVVRAEPMRFKEESVRGIVTDVIRPWYNGYRFFIQNVHRYEAATNTTFHYNLQENNLSSNIMDKWILAALHKLIKFVNVEMTAYRLYTVVPELIKFIGDMTNWYIQFNRDRIRGNEGEEDCKAALGTLCEVIYTLTKVMAPFTPFVAESMYQNLKEGVTDISPDVTSTESIHFLLASKPNPKYFNEEIVLQFQALQSVVDLVRLVRTQKNLPMKLPLKTLVIINQDQKMIDRLKYVEDYIKSVLNISEAVFQIEGTEYGVHVVLKPNFAVLGRRLGKDLKKVCNSIKEASKEQVAKFQAGEAIEFDGYEMKGDDLIVEIKAPVDGRFASADDKNFVTLVDTHLDEVQKTEYLARETITRIQKLRKTAGISSLDKIYVVYEIIEKSGEFDLEVALTSHLEMMEARLENPLVPHTSTVHTGTDLILSEENDIKSTKVVLSLFKRV